MGYKLLIIQPSHYYSKDDRRLIKLKRRSVVSLSLPYLAALVPEGWEVSVVDEVVQDVNFDARVDVVALSVWTINSLRAYEISDEFRKRGVVTIMGGPHTFFYPEEAAKHCDAVGCGEGENIFRQMLSDAVSGSLKRFYKAEILHDLSGLPIPRYDVLNLKYYGVFKTFSVQTSRGCPFKCDFCSERFYLGEKYRCRPVEEVVEEIKCTGAKRIFFADSNFGGNKRRAMELMEALIPLRIRWSTLWSLHLCEDKEFLDLAQRSGLLHVNIGMESISEETLKSMNKRHNKVLKYSEILEDLNRRGISYSLNFIFGWDNEDASVFDSTLNFLFEHKVPVAYFNLLTPEKGTPLYERMREEGRLFDVNEIGRFAGQICYYKPEWCSAAELEQGIQKMYREFYSFRSMLSRLSLPLSESALASWFINFSQRRMVFNGTGSNNFDNY
ncbi:MAG: radical SAM protein [Verrucomicrobiae bacterium]|nr:radical SAM protein [Verrucomicrobiae bacterium]